ncbi:E3 ubiquitin-protein ligase TTC3 isoform X2 [Latimeria chalumnae]
MTSDVMKQYCDKIKIVMFWPILFPKKDMMKCQPIPLFIVKDLCCVEVCDLSLKKLQKIEILEAVFETATKAIRKPKFVDRLLSISHKIINLKVFDVDEARVWLEDAGETSLLLKLQRLGEICSEALAFFFTRYAEHIIGMASGRHDLMEGFEITCDSCKMGEDLKRKGNDEFKKNNFECAIKLYNKAIDYCPKNHLLYGNRALCFLRVHKYEKALCDGKRATVLKPDWAKGHYRFCDALFGLKEYQKALETNEKAQKLCEGNSDGHVDLVEQNIRIRSRIEELKGTKTERKDVLRRDHHRKKKAAVPASEMSGLDFLDDSDGHASAIEDSISEISDSQDTVGLSESRERGRTEEYPTGFKNQGSWVEEVEKISDHASFKNDSKKALEKQKAKSKSPASQQAVRNAIDSVSPLPKLKSLVQDGYTALSDQRCRNAEQAFSQAISLLDVTKLKAIYFATIDYAVLIYGHASALLGIGQPEELTEAKNLFKQIVDQYSEEHFQCFGFYGSGRVYHRQNRFSDAFKEFAKSLKMVNLKIVPGILTWPTSTVVIEESRTEKLKGILEAYIEECKFPPEPDAVCRYQQCQSSSKIQIYFTDPDFKGFIRLMCCQFCRVEFHINCWKKLKTISFSDKNDKDFLEDQCFTPDCGGSISKIVIIGSTGLVKCEFESKMIKRREPPKPVVKQKCSSIRKLKSKEDCKLRRKQLRKEAMKAERERQEESNQKSSGFKNNIDSGPVQPWPPNSDRVLQQIIENRDLIQSGVVDTSQLLADLMSWRVINQEQRELFEKKTAQSEVIEELINILTQKNNHVMTRVFLHFLNLCQETEPKLHDWTQRLNNIGLKAAEEFISHYRDCLEELNFAPLFEFWDEKYGEKPESVNASTSTNVILGFLQQSAPEIIRGFIWMLEENRTTFPSLHHCLNEFFDIMDGPCIVLKKQENEDISNIGVKFKGKSRKKKQKEVKPILVISGTIGGGTQDEDGMFTDEDSLDRMFLSSHDPFTVPEYLQDQLEAFENLYDDNSSSSRYQRFLDNDPDPSRESLYDYFAQILKEHGPMEIDNELLTSQFKIFPSEAQELVQNSGGLKPFLLESLRFVMMDNLIGLMKHAVLLKETAEENDGMKTELENDSSALLKFYKENSAASGIHLDPAAKEFQPNRNLLDLTNGTLSFIESPRYNDDRYLAQNYYSAETTLELEGKDGHLSHPNNSSGTPLLAVNPSSLPTNLDIPLSAITSACHVPIGDKFGFDNEPFLPDETYPYETCNSALQQEIISNGHSLKTAVPNNTEELGMLYLFDYTHSAMNKSASSTFIHHQDNLNTALNAKQGNSGNWSVRQKNVYDKATIRKHTLRPVAVQVYKESTVHTEVNTDPYYPIETQQGDILRMEKEHKVLKDQLKETKEKYEQLQERSQEEISDLEGKLNQEIENCKVSKTEVEWLRQSLETEIKKGQQEKREKQELFKVLKNKIKSLNELIEKSSRNIEDKEQEYKKYLKEFLEVSNKSAAEKVKLEELIKKNEDSCQESGKRAVTAEVSVLESGRDIELYKLNKAIADAEMNLNFLRTAASWKLTSSIPPLQSMKSDWESYLLNVKSETHKVESQFQERISMVTNGGKLGDLTPVQVATFIPPIPVMQDQPPVNDPAVLLYSTSQTFHSFPSALPASSIQPQARSLLNSQPQVLNQYPVITLPLTEAPQVPARKACLDQAQVAQSSENPSSKQPAQSKPAGSGPLQHSKNSFEKIIDRLLVMFPHYNSQILTYFIKEVRTSNGGTLSGLAYDEIITRVADLILAHQDITRAQLSGRTNQKSTSSAAVQPAVQAEPAQSSADATPSVTQSQPWKITKAQNKLKWQKSTPFEEDPCIICHDDLSQETLCVLECGHRFHKECIKEWLKKQSTCPTCRVHALLPEDFPALAGRIKLPHVSIS